MAITYNNLYLDTRQRLRRAGVEAAQLEAREILCYAADKTREQFFRDSSLYVSSEVEKRVESLVQRRLAGEPVAYIIGEWEFYGLPLDLSRDVLIPRSDTEVLAERAIALARAAGEGARVLDLCAGSGCVGLAVASQVPTCRVVLADVSEAALRLCKQNVRRNGLNARVTCVLADALESPSSSLWDFDVIACNPPYTAPGAGTPSEDGARRAARQGDSLSLEDVARGARYALRFGGRLCLCLRPQRLAEAVEVFHSHQLEPKRLRLVQQRAGKAPFLFLLECRRGGKPGMEVGPVLLLEREDGSPTQEIEAIYGDYRDNPEHRKQ